MLGGNETIKHVPAPVSQPRGVEFNLGETVTASQAAGNVAVMALLVEAEVAVHKIEARGPSCARVEQ